MVGQHFTVNKSIGYIKKSESKIRECIKASAALHVNIPRPQSVLQKDGKSLVYMPGR